jgi:cyclophilin family peptidyl-prolyl cis-trans isomerase
VLFGRAKIWLFLSAAIALLVAVSSLVLRTKTQPAPPPSRAPTSEGRPSPPASDLLNQIVPPGAKSDVGADGPVPTNEQLEKQFDTITANQRDVDQLRARSTRAAAARNTAEIRQDIERGKQEVALLNVRLQALEKDLDAARSARPADSVVQWLTGELLLVAGGEPEEIRPYFERALGAGLDRSRLFTSMARVEFELNHFDKALAYASNALERAPQNQEVWEIYMRAAFAAERFKEVIQGLYAAFPDSQPDWATAMRSDAQRLLAQWQREQELRKADEKANNLPLVRLIIEHRAFTHAQQDPSHSREKVTGRGEVRIVLFEDDAPAAVADFVNLVEQRFYDGTRFHWADAGHMVVGGDPNTKNNDPEDDGAGGPGYSIPDESRSPRARGHFRGSISTLQTRPNGTGSQFFIALVPCPEFDGHFTTFGRVISGQEVLDQISEGRTNRQVGQFGKIIPGDLLVRAEVIRKRPHRYEVIKANP